MDWKKLLATVVITLVVAGGATGVYFAANNSGKAESNEKSKQSSVREKPSVNAACNLVTKSDVESVFGLKFKNGAPERRAGSSSTACKFEQETDKSVTARLSAISLSVRVDPFESATAAETSLKTTKSTDRIGDKVMFVATSVPGVGDEAFFFQGQAPGILKTQEYMYARKGNTVVHFVAIKLDGIDHEQTRSHLIAIAKKALD